MSNSKRIWPPGKLILLVGPSGSGKSSYARSAGYKEEQIISSDAIRETLCGDFQDQTKNTQVFAALHAIVKTRIEHGLLTVVDATNIRSADRRAFLQLAPKDTAIEYHVINRPVKEKLKTGGWRLNVTVHNPSTDAEPTGLIERHDQVFQSNLKYIMNGDGDNRVTVKDFRTF